MSANTITPDVVGDAIPKGSLVLVTGANGFIASHICDQLLAAGYTVRGSVRSREKGEKIRAVLEKRHPEASFEYVVVPDFAQPGAFADVVQGAVGVVHTASDLSFGNDPKKVVTPVVEAVKQVLQAANDAGTVKRFVYTSSSLAASQTFPDKVFDIDDTTWNDETVKKVWAAPEGSNSGIDVYAASKCAGERAAWEFMEREKPGFVLNTVLPNFNMGYVLDTSVPTSTNGYITRIWETPGNEEVVNTLKYFPPQHHIDVQDDAKLHVAALAEADVQGERLLAFAEPFNFNDVIAIFRRLNPSAKWPEDAANPQRDRSNVKTARSIELLSRYGQKGFTSMEDSIKNAVYS